MSPLGLPDWFGKPLAVLLIDLSLAGDNALAIALVCMALPPRTRRPVLLVGTLAAIVLRVLLAGLAGLALTVAGLQLAGGVVLALVALNLALRDPRRVAVRSVLDERSGVWSAALVVTLIDVLMSLDNVFALAAVAGGSLFYLGAGLVLSVTILMFGSTLLAHLLGRLPNLARLGAALLGWVAGQMAVSDPLVQGALATGAPVLPSLVPALTALYIYLLGHTTPKLPAPREVLAAQPPPPPRIAARPVAAAAEPSAAEPSRASAPDRLLLVMFVALCAIVGLFLGGLFVFGGGAIR